MRFLLRLLGNDAATADRATDVTKSLTADVPTSMAATAYAASLIGSILAMGLLIDIAGQAQ